MQNSHSRIIAYPGSFDPITMGHVSLVQRALAIFDSVIVSVVSEPPKPMTFSLEERVDMAREVFVDEPRVSVEGFDGLLPKYIKACHADAVLRGLRAVSDFDCEFQLALMNRRQDRHVETLFLMTDSQWLYTSSSGIKDLARLGGNITGLVPETVAKRLHRRFIHRKGARSEILKTAAS